MSKFFIIVKNEFHRYFTTPLAAVYLVAFLMLNGSFAIYFGHFMERGQANLSVMFAYQPWLYLFFLPGISMRLWSEEFRGKTIVQLITLPVAIRTFVWGKFCASWLFCLLALILTFPFWITVNWLGTPENNIILITYIGSALLAGAMLSVAQAMSALSKNAVIALVLAVITNLIFFLSGLEVVLAFFRSFLPNTIIDLFASFSFLNHFSNFSRGVISIPDIIYFLLLIILFNYVTILIIDYKTCRTSPLLRPASIWSNLIIASALIFSFCGINLLAAAKLQNFRYDFTHYKEFSLSPAAQKILQNIPQPIIARLYYTPILEQRNPLFREMFNRAKYLLSTMAAAAPDKFHFQISFPEPLNKAEDLALASNLHALTLADNNTNAFFGITLSSETDDKRVIPFLSPERINFLEQDIFEKIQQLDNKPLKLGLLTTLPLFSIEEKGVATAEWKIVDRLRAFYDLSLIGKPQDIEQQDMLMIIHPKETTPEWTTAIKKFADTGKGVLLFLDPAAEAMRLYAPTSTLPESSKAESYEKMWNFRFSQNAVVADLANSTAVNTSNNSELHISQDIIQFYIRNTGINKSSPVTASLQQLLVSSAGALLPGSENIPIRFIPLLQSSTISALMSANIVRDSMHPDKIITYFKSDNKAKTVAAYIESEDDSRPFKVIVAADTDFLYDNFWVKTGNIDSFLYDIPVTENADFVLNALEFLSQKLSLAYLRRNTEIDNPFHDLELQKRFEAQKYQQKNREIIQKIDNAKAAVQQIWAKKDFEQRENFIPDELAVIAGIRKTLDNLRLELLDLKKQQFEHYHQIDIRVKFFNIYFIPLLLLLGLGLPHLKFHKKTYFKKPKITKTMLLLLLGGSIILTTGLIADYQTKQLTQTDYMDKALFPQLPQQINQIKKITLKNKDQELTLYMENGLWQLHDKPHFAVYQKRVRSFLSALLEATYFEKKSSSAAHLGKFGLLPIDNHSSTAVSVTLEDENGKIIEQFDVGKYDINLGRGTKAAYIRFPQKVQVWLAKIDLIDLSLSSADWTYAQGWNLRFGRFQNTEGEAKTTKLAFLSRDLLNTQLEKAVPAFEPIEEINSVKLLLESGDIVIIRLLRKGENNYLAYKFPDKIKENNLQLFAKYASQTYYLISKDKAELLNHDFGTN